MEMVYFIFFILGKKEEEEGRRRIKLAAPEGFCVSGKECCFICRERRERKRDTREERKEMKGPDLRCHWFRLPEFNRQ